MAILMVGITTGVTATGPVMQNSLALSESQLLLDTLTKAISGELRYATDIVPIDTSIPEVTPPLADNEEHSFPMDFTYTSQAFGPQSRFYNVGIKNDGGDRHLRIMVQGRGYDFVGSGIYSNLEAEIESIIYDKTNLVFQVKLTIFFPDKSEKKYEFSIRSILESGLANPSAPP